MKPKPFSPLNHFTVPLAIGGSFRDKSGCRTVRSPGSCTWTDDTSGPKRPETYVKHCMIQRALNEKDYR